jgi:hypothetical protein
VVIEISYIRWRRNDGVMVVIDYEKENDYG